MASRVEGFDEKILACAKEEFLEKGYTDASIRTIAQNAGVSTSTIIISLRGVTPHFSAPLSMSYSPFRTSTEYIIILYLEQYKFITNRIFI